MAAEEQVFNNFVEIKSEPIEYNVNVKVEPPDTDFCNNAEQTTSTDQNLDTSNIKVEKDKACGIVEFVENITVKIEPTYYSSEDEVLASYQTSQDFQAPPRTSFPTILRIPQLRKKKKASKHNSATDEDYAPKKKKKKVTIEPVKKTYTTKAKRAENCYSDNVTKHIELVTITEDERQMEFKELWQSRQHMRYTCEDCAIGFVMEEPYVLHMKNHAPEAGDHECDICHCRLRTADTLYKHRLRHHRRYRCAVCHRIHKDKETAASHVMSEHVREAFTCDQCGKGFKRPAYLKKHVAQQHTRGQQHECPICARVFFDRSMYKTHYRRHNDEVRNPIQRIFICDSCCRQFKSKAALKRHLLVHARERTLPCPQCPLMFQTTRGLRLHRINKHMEKPEQVDLLMHEREGTVANPSSPATFQTTSGLTLDTIDKHTEKPEQVRKLQQCPQCERECTTPALLRQHIRRMHTDRTKKYQCDYCKRFYYTKGEVRAHIVWSHAPSRGERALFCCGREFRTRTRLKDHIAIHHLKVERQRIHKCDQCDKAFANKQVLNRHKKSHTDLSYPCPVCGARFKCAPYVKVHHQIKHLNMTRAQIKALKQNKHISDQPEDLSMKKSDTSEICFDTVTVKQEVDSDCEISVPLFDFENLKR